MKNNNFLPRLSAFVISLVLSLVIIFSVNNSGLIYEKRIIFLSLITMTFWLVLLLKSNGLKEYRLVRLMLIVFMLIGIASFMCVTVWHSGYLTINPLIAINKYENGIGRDSLYHCALTSGIEFYGYPTLLVNSTAFHNYHFGSHIIMALFSYIFRIPPFFSYCYCYPLFFFPIYIYLILSVISRIRRYFNLPAALSVLDMFCVLCFISYVIFPKDFTNSIGWAKTSWLISESFHIGAIIFLLFFDVLLYANEKHHFTNKKLQSLFLLGIIPLFVLVLSITKISFGAVFACSVSYYLLRFKNFKIKYLFLSWLYFIIVGLCHYIPKLYYSPFVSASTGDNYGIDFLYFLENSIDSPNLWGIHLIFYFSFSLIFLIYQISIRRNWHNLKNDFVSKKTVIEEILILICIFGSIPGLLFSIGGGSSFYISSIQQIIGVILLVGYNIPNKLYDKVVDPINRLQKIALIIISICTSFNFILSINDNCKTIFNDCKTNDLQYAESTKGGTYLSSINEINKLTQNHKSDYYIYIDETANIWERFSDHDSSMFFYPAMTGVVCIGEYYLDQGNIYTNDGSIKNYGWPIIPNTNEPKMTRDDALQKAFEDGKKALIIIYNNSFLIEPVNSD